MASSVLNHLKSRLWTFYRLARIDSCILAFAIIAVPATFYKKSCFNAMILAAPILTIAICGFIINDVNDIEKDIINHPDRPLPKQEIRITTAVVLYFIFLAISLIMIKMFISGASVFYYIIFLLGFSNYNYIVNHLSFLKGLYVAVIGAVPIMIMIDSCNLGMINYCAVFGFVFFMLGREILMDVLDVIGDKNNLALMLGSKAIICAFALQLLGLFTIVPLIDNISKTVLFFCLLGIMIIFILLWHVQRLQHSLIITMKWFFFTWILFII